MKKLPIIAGFGGYNAAGRSSFHHGFRRTVIESLSGSQKEPTLVGLAVMCGLVKAEDNGNYQAENGETLTSAQVANQFEQQVLDATLIRKIGTQYFDVDNTPWHQSTELESEHDQNTFLLPKKQLPNPIPESWTVSEHSDKQVRVTLAGVADFKTETTRDFPVKVAGQLPDGFDVSKLYNSRFHPRGLQLTIAAISDAMGSLGVSWDKITHHVAPDQIAVYAGSVFGQMDEYGHGGMVQSRLRGGRVSSKQLALGLNTMPADFINAYVLGSVGSTGGITGACATFLYNLRSGVEDIKEGRARIAIVGSSEAPINQEIMEGFAAMSALATDDGLKKLDGVETADHRRASRPFSYNCGFSIGESAQYAILVDDELLVELGLQAFGAVPDVFVNADGFKKSISAPGPGNFLTLMRAVASANAILGEESVAKRSFVHAHGSSTPANRTTESELFDRVAEAYGIQDWPITAVKAFVGHSIGPASGDQLVSALGSFAYGVIPGIKTITEVADDVFQKHLKISPADIDVGEEGLDVSFINSKGFGGNNATGVIVAPHIVNSMLEKRYGNEVINSYREKLAVTQQKAAEYDRGVLKGEYGIHYYFGEGMIDDREMVLSKTEMKIPGYKHPVDLKVSNPFSDMTS